MKAIRGEHARDGVPNEGHSRAHARDGVPNEGHSRAHARDGVPNEGHSRAHPWDGLMHHGRSTSASMGSGTPSTTSTRPFTRLRHRRAALCPRRRRRSRTRGNTSRPLGLGGFDSQVSPNAVQFIAGPMTHLPPLDVHASSGLCWQAVEPAIARNVAVVRSKNKCRMVPPDYVVRRARMLDVTAADAVIPRRHPHRPGRGAGIRCLRRRLAAPRCSRLRRSAIRRPNLRDCRRGLCARCRDPAARSR